MSVKKLFDNNKQIVTVGKFLKLGSPDTLGDGIESAEHLQQAVNKRDYFLPPIDYSDPANFVKFGSAEQYYKNAFDYIASYYPYDGSNLERVEFYNKINPLEKYILEDIYPTSTGFVTLGSNYGSITPNASGYYSSSEEYIQIKGGPHSGSVYNETKNRTSNLEFGGDLGNTVEFFLKKNSLINSSTESERQVVFDLWNGAATTAADYGRLRIELVSGSEDRFYVTMRSGSNGFTNVQIPSAGGQTISDGTFRNFSFVFNTSGSSPTIDFFVNGTCVETAIGGAVGDIGLVTGSMIGNIGALRTDIAGLPGAAQGYGKLSGSIDEFRFWKTNRNDEQIGRYWFDNVGGGTDKYDANVSLGVYLKFNEGITQTASIDQVCLDYSGRLSNGLFVGYDTARSRNTGSAINSLNLESVVEIGDPIVRTDNSIYSNARSRYILSGSNYDYNNNARLLNHFPNWIIEAEENEANELVNVTQIISSYFDTLYNQLTALKSLKHVKYVSGSLSSSINEYPYNDRLVESMGLEMPEFFQNIGALQQFLQRDEQINFDNRLVEVKNSIYKNIYNNLAFILKSKGTEKSIRNFIRCLGVSEEIIALNTYPDNSDFEIKSNYLSTTSTKKFADFTGLLKQADDEATVYQYPESGNVNSKGFITGSSAIQEFAFSLQAEVVFPDKDNHDLLPYDMPRVLTSSIMGFHTPADTNQTSTDLTWETAGNDHGLQVFLVRSPGEYAKVYQPDYLVRDGFFLVKNRAGTTLLTSSIFNDVYDNQKWNLTLSLRPKKYPFNDGILGASVATDGYTLDLYGVNYDTGIKRNSFLASTPVSYVDGSAIIKSNKRVYVGAHRTNFTGSVVNNTDVRASSIRFWSDYLPTGTLDLQARETDTHGLVRPYKNAYSFQANNPGVYIPDIQTLALNWDFANITGSDASGRFTVTDISSGSVVGDYPSEYQGSTFSKFNLRQHSGRGDFFGASFTPVRKAYVYVDKLQIPEYVGGDEMVQSLTTDEQTFGIYTRPETFYFAVERSMYRSISNRMLELFASIEDFNNLIGEPVNKYRLDYKRMEKVREIFFRKVKNDIPDLERYVDYYKWLDTSMNQVIEEFFPESARHASDVRKVVENHVLERPKIRHKVSILRDKHPGGPGGIEGSPRGTVCLDIPGWAKNHHPISGNENENCTWWRTRAERNVSPLVASGGVLDTRNAVLNAISREIDPPLDRADLPDPTTILRGPSSVVCLSAKLLPPYYGGINQDLSKKRRLRDLTFDRFEAIEPCAEELEPNTKKKVSFRATKDGVEYKGNLVTPFTALSSSVTSGYNASLITSGLTGITLTNLHEDSVYPYRHSVPMQGPFTERWVGGIQARHNAPFRTADRAEEYKLTIASGTGSITTLTVENTPKGQYLRGLASKSPVNIQNIKTVVTGHTSDKGVREVGNYSRYHEVVQGNDRSQTNMDFAFNNSHYSYSMPSAFVTPPARRTAGLTGSADYPAPRQRPLTAATVVLIPDGTPLAIDDGKTVIIENFDGSVHTLTMTAATRSATQIDRSAIGNANDFAVELKASLDLAVVAGTLKGTVSAVENDGNGNPRRITITSEVKGDIGNKPVTGTLITGGGGEIICNPADDKPSSGNGDLSFTGGSDGARTNETIIADRFSSPGSKQDSKQQFRDVNSDQFSPNNALPFRNIAVRLPHNKDLTDHSLFGGIVGVTAATVNLITDSTPLLADDGKTVVITNHDGTTHTLTMTPATRSATQIDRSVIGNADDFATELKASLDLAVAAGTLKATVSKVQLDANGNPRMIILTSAVKGESGNQSVVGTLITGGGGEIICNPAANQPASGNGTLAFTGGTEKASVHKVQRNGVQHLEIGETFPTTTIVTGSTFDNAYVTRPVPAADRSQWTTYLSGSDNSAVYDQYIAHRSRYPESISFAPQVPVSEATFNAATENNLSLQSQFKWANNRSFVPWKQISNSENPYAKYYTRNNTYEIGPQIVQEVQAGTGIPVRSYADGSRGTRPTSVRSVTDRKGNVSNYYYSLALREAPVTSRYKPLLHQIRTPLGTPAKTSNEMTDVSLKYSYGNDLMGFANRELNRLIQGKTKFSYGTIKRPYEILREQFVPSAPRSISGADLIKVFSYSETIYPKEVYTYLSGSRARLSFANDFWKDDSNVLSYDVSSFVKYSDLLIPANQTTFVRQLPRIETPFTTSQGYAVRAKENTPFNTLDASFPIATGAGKASIWSLDSFMYADSITSLSAILTASAPVLLADAATMPCGELLMTHYGTVDDGVTNALLTNGTASYQTSSVNSAQYVYNIPVTTLAILTVPAVAATATLTAVETTPSILNGSTIIISTGVFTVTFTFDQTLAPDSALLRVDATNYKIGVSGLSTTNEIINAIYSSVLLCKTGGEIDVTPTDPGAVSAAMTITADVAGAAINGTAITGTGISSGQVTQTPFAGGVNATTRVGGERPEPRSPGSAYTRPAWTAGIERRYVDGGNKGTVAQSQYPFYNTYEDFAKDIRLAAKDHTIIPEFRVSEHISQYEQQGSLFSIISASLEITGANGTNFNGTNPLFYERFSQTDDIEFLEDFMPTSEGDRNYIFNKYPRHFEINSEAIVKLLPYNGFYPVDRTLDLATLFSSSYGPNAVVTGGSAANKASWRSVLRPFYSPGIMYNTIKSGVAVDYPIRRSERNDTQFEPVAVSSGEPLKGCLSGTLAATAEGAIPAGKRRNLSDIERQTADVNRFYWGDRLPFEAILDPAEALRSGFERPTVLSDINSLLALDASGSISIKSLDDSLYKKAVSNFLANVPKFFLKKKENKYGSDGYLTKFVSQFGSPPKAGGETDSPVRTVNVDKNSAYMMEIGMLKTDDFNFYSNPYAYGIPTATGSTGWDALTTAQTPSGSNWPTHRGEFAPYTPPHYYGPSLARITFMPTGDKTEYTLEEIINNDRGEVFVSFLNESGSYYDITSGSFVDRDGNTVTTTHSPDYGWNRAWQNRMDIDASINIGNEFPIDGGGKYKSLDPNKWVIMPKWECPTLDFPNRATPSALYEFSSSVTPGAYTQQTQGMWHQYGVMPNNNEGSYLYIKDIPTGEEEEYDFVAIGTAPTANTDISYKYVSKVPSFVSDANKTVRSLADLVGFDPDEIIRKGFDPSKAKRIGELAETNEKSLSEAILALPFYIDKEQKPRLITLQAPADKLGPKIKKFRKQFTKFSLPPSLASKLLGMVPRGYPNIPDLINPFGGDEYDSILSGETMAETPVVYLMEHKVNLTRQDLADIWQGVMPDLSKGFSTSLAAVDHYMPGDNVEEVATRFPEVLKQQLNLGSQRSGHPRYDLLDVAKFPDKLGLFPDIKWLVFKVKERGISDYSQMIVEEVEGEAAFTYDSVRQTLLNEGISEDQANTLMRSRDEFSKNMYIYKHRLNDPTFNWPYDYCSLLELGKINTKIGFRPELDRENSEAEDVARRLEEAVEDGLPGGAGVGGLPGIGPDGGF